MIQETPREFCVIAEYEDGDSFCLAKFMREEDARAWLEQQEPKEYVKWSLRLRVDRGGEVRWEE